jgi:large subunit ribosomal protein L24
MARIRIKKGDTVQVITGKDRGVKGKVIEVFPEADRILVEGVNRIKKHTKVGQNNRGAKTGGIITTEASIHVSNVMVVDPDDGRPTRIGSRTETVEKRRPDGTTYSATRNVRVSKRTGKDLS